MECDWKGWLYLKGSERHGCSQSLEGMTLNAGSPDDPSHDIISNQQVWVQVLHQGLPTLGQDDRKGWKEFFTSAGGPRVVGVASR